MKTVDVIEQWVEDAPIDSLHLGQSAMDIHKLHSKYLRLWGEAKSDANQTKSELKALKYDKKEFIANPTHEVMKTRGWQVPERKILKADIAEYISSDPHVTELENKLSEEETALDMLQDILKQITNRNWLIQSALKDRAFLAGE